MEHQNLFAKYFKANTLIIFSIIIGIYWVALSLEFKLVFTNDFYYESILQKDKNATRESISYFITQDRAEEWKNYPIAILVVLFPAVTIGFALFTGSVLKDYKLKYKDFFSVALKAQIIFALNYLLGIILKWQKIIDRNFYNISNNYDYQSLLVFFDLKKLPPELFYPLQCINIAEFIHILFLSLGVSYVMQLKYFKALGFTFLYYGTALFFWIVFTVFLQITL